MTLKELIFLPHPIVVYDTEFTSWLGAKDRNWSGAGEHKEIVQIGAVLLDASGDETGAFSQFVLPKINPVLSEYFTELTGITNAHINTHGQPLLDGLRSFAKFCSSGVLVCSFGNDHEIIQQNCDLIGIKNPLNDLNLLNIRQLVCEFAKITSSEIISAELPVVFGLQVQTSAHDALADARAIASVLRHLKTSLQDLHQS